MNPAILAAARIAGVDKIFKLGGAQAVAALAYGTESVPKVDKLLLLFGIAQPHEDIGRPVGNQGAMDLGMVCVAQHTQVGIAFFQQSQHLGVVENIVISHNQFLSK